MFHIRAAPQRERSDPPKVEGSASMFKFHTALQRDRSNPPIARKGFAFDVRNSHRAAARAIRPTLDVTSCAAPERGRFDARKVRKGLVAMLKLERSDPPKVRRGFTSQPFSEFARHRRAHTRRKTHNKSHQFVCEPAQSKCTERAPQSNAGPLRLP